jgi:hypothetical protein
MHGYEHDRVCMATLVPTLIQRCKMRVLWFREQFHRQYLLKNEAKENAVDLLSYVEFQRNLRWVRLQSTNMIDTCTDHYGVIVKCLTAYWQPPQQCSAADLVKF